MKKHLRFTLVLLLAAFLAGCQGPCDSIESISGPSLTSGTADFATYVAAGANFTAGFQSNGLVDRHQARSFPAIFARQVGKTVLQDGQGDFTFPSMGLDGFPPLLEIKSFSPLIINNTGRALGYPAANYLQSTSFHNLGIPGSIAVDFADTTRYHATPEPNMFSIVARYRGTVAQQVLAQAPTFISYEYGTNEVLGFATSGGALPLFPSASYAALLTGHMNAIHAARPAAKLAIFSVPDIGSLPFFTTFRPATIMLATGAAVPLRGRDGAGNAVDLSPNDYVLLTAKDSLAVGTGFPVGAYNFANPAAPGNGRPLTNQQVLDVGEQSALRLVASAMNAAIDSVAMRPWIAKVDLAAALTDLAASGYLVGSTRYTNAFVTGGLFSLDGIHPNDLTHAILANAMIDAVNARFGGAIPHATVTDYATGSSSAARRAPGESGLQGMRIDGLEAGLKALFPGLR